MNIPEAYFMYLNIIIALIYLAFIIIGYCKGFIYGVISVIYTGLALFISWLLSPVLSNLYPIVNMESESLEAQLLNKFIDTNQIINNVLYFVIIYLVLKVLYIIISLIVKAFNKVPVLGTFNKILGGILGFVNATIVALLISVVLTLPVFKNGNEARDASVLKYIKSTSDKVVSYIIDNMDIKFDASLDKFDADEVRLEIKEWILNNNEKLQ